MRKETFHQNQGEIEKLKVAVLEGCDFPIVESNIEGYKVITLPDSLRKLFDEEGMAMVRINSIELAKTLPDFGGKASANYSLPPHQDHLPTDPRRFLILSKLTEGARGSSTVVMQPEIAAALLPISEKYFAEHRSLLGAEREYDQRFVISEEQYNHCFDTENGFEETVAELIGENTSESTRLFTRSGLLGYLVRGPHADELLETLLQGIDGEYISEDWERGGVVIIDNARTFHARRGGNNPPLKRNYAV